MIRTAIVSLLLLGVVPGAPGLAEREAADRPRAGRQAPSAVGPASVTVAGHVRDEAGAPIAGANVQLWDQSGRSAPVLVVTDATGAFTAIVPPVSRVTITAAHPDFGLQWTASVGFTAPAWDGFRWAGPMPDAPVDLRLRRGVVLRGRVIDADNRPLGHDAIVLVPAYVGSGPATIAVATDVDGRFAFERAVLSRFELVPRSLEHWHPRKAGDYLRVAQAPDAWLATARSGGSLDLQVERYRLVPVSIDVTALQATSVQMWKRWGANFSEGTAVQVDVSGTVQMLLEQGVEHELWVVAGMGTKLTAPWTRGIQRTWLVTPPGPLALTMTGGSTLP